MSLIINGETASQGSKILKVNGMDVNDLQVNGVSVWKYLPEILIGADLKATASNSGSATFNQTYSKPAGYNTLYIESYCVGVWVYHGEHYWQIYGVNGGSQTLLWSYGNGGEDFTRPLGSFNVSSYAQIRLVAYVRSNAYTVSAGYKNVKWRA